MTLAKRRLLYFIFIAAFCTITPLVILYANGYQLSLNSRSLVKTGMLIVDTYPQNAEISLNGELQTDFVNKILNPGENVTTPAKIKNLIPGDYMVSFNLDGYWPWEKKLTIRPGESTYAEDVILFKKSAPNMLSAGEKYSLVTSPDTDKIMVTGRVGADIFNANDKSLVASTSSGSVDDIWSSDSKMALVGNAVIRLDQAAPAMDIEKTLGKNIINTKWSPSDSSALYYQIGNQIFRYDLTEQKSESLFPENAIPQSYKGLPMSDFVRLGNRLYVAFYKQARSIVLYYDLDNRKAVREVSIPSSREVTFANYDQGNLNLLDRSNGNLHLINFDNFYPLENTITDISDGYWVTKDRLLGWNESEIFIYESNIKQKNLLTRIAQPIRRAVWHPSNNYIIYSTDKEITSFELDDREKHNTVALVSGENFKGIALDKKATTLYFIGRIEGKEGLFATEL